MVCGTVHGNELGIRVRPRSVSQPLSLFCFQWCGQLLKPETFFDGVQDFLMNVLSHPPIAAAPPGQPPELVYIPFEVCYVFSGGVRANEFHGSRFHLQVSFHPWFPPAPADNPVVLALAGDSGMEEHL